MVYSLRSLFISFAIVIVVVLLIVLRTFSTLRSQEKGQVKIDQSRLALQTLGPAIINVKEFESGWSVTSVRGTPHSLTTLMKR
jgi:hypothetical protein